MFSYLLMPYLVRIKICMIIKIILNSVQCLEHMKKYKTGVDHNEYFLLSIVRIISIKMFPNVQNTAVHAVYLLYSLLEQK